LDVAPHGLVDGPRSWHAVAELFGVPDERLAAAAAQGESSLAHLGAVFLPFRPWWDAVGVPYPPELGPSDGASA
jgi:hypothetical protein